MFESSQPTISRTVKDITSRIAKKWIKFRRADILETIMKLLDFLMFATMAIDWWIFQNRRATVEKRLTVLLSPRVMR